jgi:6-pyruvoyltetrahydropterin/6-carboxytetrahydropterin synthase
MIRVTRRYRFSASHRLHSDRFSEATNREIYGKCNHPFGHGHDYVLEVTVRGPVDQDTGLAVDLVALDGLIRVNILEAFDRRNLNGDVKEFHSVVPTTENLAIEIGRRLREGWGGAFPGAWPKFERVRVHETRNNTVELDYDEE